MPQTLTAESKMSQTDEDRRRSKRKPHVIEAWIWSPTSTNLNDKEEVRAVNLSRHGVGFQIEREIPVAHFMMIEIGMGNQKVSSEVRIISCRECEDGKFEVGAEFC